MTIITLQILTTFMVLCWFDGLRALGINTSIPNLLLALVGYKPWTKKKDLPWRYKWMACYFCTSFWIGVINASLVYFYTNNWRIAVLLIMSNTILSRLFDYLLGYQSFKQS
jgi:hypothetical protein